MPSYSLNGDFSYGLDDKGNYVLAREDDTSCCCEGCPWLYLAFSCKFCVDSERKSVYVCKGPYCIKPGAVVIDSDGLCYTITARLFYDCSKGPPPKKGILCLPKDARVIAPTHCLKSCEETVCKLPGGYIPYKACACCAECKPKVIWTTAEAYCRSKAQCPTPDPCYQSDLGGAKDKLDPGDDLRQTADSETNCCDCCSSCQAGRSQKYDHYCIDGVYYPHYYSESVCCDYYSAVTNAVSNLIDRGDGCPGAPDRICTRYKNTYQGSYAGGYEIQERWEWKYNLGDYQYYVRRIDYGVGQFPFICTYPFSPRCLPGSTGTIHWTNFTYQQDTLSADGLAEEHDTATVTPSPGACVSCAGGPKQPSRPNPKTEDGGLSKVVGFGPGGLL